MNGIYYNSNENAKSRKQMTVGTKKLLQSFYPTVIIVKKIRKTKELFMITETNIYISLILACFLLAFSARLGLSLSEAK